jgi:hypothetical protein
MLAVRGRATVQRQKKQGVTKPRHALKKLSVTGSLRELSRRLRKTKHPNPRQSEARRAAKLVAEVDGTSKVEALRDRKVGSPPASLPPLMSLGDGGSQVSSYERQVSDTRSLGWM